MLPSRLGNSGGFAFRWQNERLKLAFVSWHGETLALMECQGH